MIVYYYTDHRGLKYGSTNRQKIQLMAEQNHIQQIEQCDIAEYDGHLLSSEFY